MMELKKTALHDVHVKLGARMVEFAGFHMPIQYHSIREEHRRVRETVGMFDVSHMGEIIVKGPKALDMVQKVTINDASKLAVGQVQYSAMCYEDGGIVDDLLVYRFADHFLLVVNASNKDKDYEWILKNKIDGCEVLDVSDDYTQLAVQGKKAEPTLQKLTDVDLSAIKYYWFTEGELAGVNMIISRTGYTGEPGFELYFANEHAVDVWNKIMEAGKEFDIEPIGLGARDTFRLEKKMCLYGNDIDETTNPIEAGLGWITKVNKGDFIGRDAILKVKEEGIKRKLVAMVSEERVLPRHGYEIVANGEVVGNITSGTLSPILGHPIALGYVNKNLIDSDVQLKVKVRNKEVPVTIVKLPFIKK
jgi:aminomethyltransferase